LIRESNHDHQHRQPRLARIGESSEVMEARVLGATHM
jgi:hypothetical protein